MFASAPPALTPRALTPREGEAITALRKGAAMYKYGSHGRPHFRLFSLSTDGARLCWFSGAQKRERCGAPRRRFEGQLSPTQRRDLYNTV